MHYWVLVLIESHTNGDVCKAGREVWEFICRVVGKVEDAKSLEYVFAITMSKKQGFAFLAIASL